MLSRTHNSHNWLSIETEARQPSTGDSKAIYSPAQLFLKKNLAGFTLRAFAFLLDLFSSALSLPVLSLGRPSSSALIFTRRFALNTYYIHI
jgi:hypothetical protein